MIVYGVVFVSGVLMGAAVVLVGSFLAVGGDSWES